MAAEGLSLEQTLDIHATALGAKLSQLREYTEAMERLIVDERDRLAGQLESHPHLELYDLANFQGTFPQAFRRSLFSLGYSTLEFGLGMISDLYREYWDLRLAAKDLRHRGIFNTKVYLEKVARVPFPSASASWADIRALNQVRNIIVHRNGIYSRKRRKPEIDSISRAMAR